MSLVVYVVLAHRDEDGLPPDSREAPPLLPPAVHPVPQYCCNWWPRGLLALAEVLGGLGHWPSAGAAPSDTRGSYLHGGEAGACAVVPCSCGI